MSYNLSAVKEKLQELGIQPKRSLGQNFLIGENTVRKIIVAVKKCQASALIEVGPGLGALTHPLKELGVPMQVIELDRAFSEYWRSLGFKVTEADALKVDWQSLNLPEGSCLVSNLPYQISSSLVIDRSIQPVGIQDMVLMFQKEVAQRIAAKPESKDMGLLSVMAQTHWDIEFVLDAGPNEFFPPPKVSSRVLAFRWSKKFDGRSELFLKLVKSAFKQRRKLLISNLKGFIGETGHSRTEWEAALKDRGHSPKVRAEELSVEDWTSLFQRFCR